MNEIRLAAHGATLALAWFLTVNAATSAVVAAAAGYLLTRQRLDSLIPRRPRRRGPRAFQAPRFWLTLRLLPAALSAAFVVVVFIPSYWAYEPREAAERFGGVTLFVLAAAGAATVVAALARGVHAWRNASRRVERWMSGARPVALAGTSTPAFEIAADRPLIALGGVFRPRLLLTRGLMAALSDAELSASVAHELGHRRAWDNLKRLAMRAAPDLLARSSAARAIERCWAAAAERAADEVAGSRDAAARRALASALVKVARSMPAGRPLAEPISTLVSESDIASRVRCLLDEAEAAETHPPRWWTPGMRLGMAGLAVVVGAGSVIAGYSPLLRVVHEVTEVLVNSAP